MGAFFFFLRLFYDFLMQTFTCPWDSLVAQLVKNLLAMRETWVRSLGWEDAPDPGILT